MVLLKYFKITKITGTLSPQTTNTACGLQGESFQTVACKGVFCHALDSKVDVKYPHHRI